MPDMKSATDFKAEKKYLKHWQAFSKNFGNARSFKICKIKLTAQNLSRTGKPVT